MEALAWSHLAQGKLPDALRAIDALEVEALSSHLDFGVALAPVLRGMVQLQSGQYAKGLAELTGAERVRLDGLTDGQKKHLIAMRLASTAEAQARLGQVLEAENALGALDALYTENARDPVGIDLSSYARGQIALGKKDPHGAVVAFQRCSEPFDLCRMALAEAQDAAGEASAANDTRTALLKANHRDALYWFVRAQTQKFWPGKKVASDRVK